MVPVPPPYPRLSLSLHKDLSDHISDSAGRLKAGGDGGNGSEMEPQPPCLPTPMFLLGKGIQGEKC